MRSPRALPAVYVMLVISTAMATQVRLSEVTVMVHDATGRPVPGAEVIAVGDDWHTVVTDASGQARLSVTPGAWEVVVLHGALAVVPTVQTVTVLASERKVVEFRALPRSAQVTGGVRFLAEPPPALRRLHVVAHSTDPVQAPLPVSIAALADDHSFALAVPPGRWRIGLLEVPLGITVRDVMVDPGQVIRADLEVDFRSLVGVTGLVFEAGLVTERLGPAFSLTTVGLYAIGRDGAHRVLATTQAAPDQSFGIFAPAPAGAPLGVFAWRPGGTAVPAAARSVAAPGSASFADFRFVVNSGTLTGTIVDATGRPVADAWVAAVSAVRYEEWMMWGKPVYAPGGAFRIRVPLGPVLVRAWRDPRRIGGPVRISIGSTDPVTVRLEVP